MWWRALQDFGWTLTFRCNKSAQTPLMKLCNFASGKMRREVLRGARKEDIIYPVHNCYYGWSVRVYTVNRTWVLHRGIELIYDWQGNAKVGLGSKLGLGQVVVFYSSPLAVPSFVGNMESLSIWANFQQIVIASWLLPAIWDQGNDLFVYRLMLPKYFSLHKKSDATND
jgi:hypothetical protein